MPSVRSFLTVVVWVFALGFAVGCGSDDDGASPGVGETLSSAPGGHSEASNSGVAATVPNGVGTDPGGGGTQPGGGGTQPGGGGTQPGGGEGIIGPEGGTLEAGSVTLVVPPGALTEAIAFSVTPTTGTAPAGVEALSSFYRFEPAGAFFSVPATIRVRLAGPAPPSAAIYWSPSSGGPGFERLSSTLSGDVVSADVDHFSTGFVGEPANGGEPSGDALRAVSFFPFPDDPEGRIDATALFPSPDGGAVLGGTFNGVVDLGSGPLGNGISGAFAARFGPSGDVLWAQALEPGEEVVRVLDGGDILVASGPGLRRLAPSGGEVWQRGFGRDGNRNNEAQARTAVEDADGNTVFAGWLDGRADFGGGMVTGTSPQPDYLASYDADGNHRWSRLFTGIQVARMEVAADGDLLVVGTYSGSEAEIGGEPFPDGGMAGGIFVARLAPDGSHRFSAGYAGGGSGASVSGVAVGADDAIGLLLSVQSLSTTDFGLGPLSEEHGNGSALLEFSPEDGALESQRSWRLASVPAQHGGHHGQLYLAGDLRGPVDFGGGILGPTEPPIPAPYPAGFYAVLEADGSHTTSAAWTALYNTQDPDDLHTVDGRRLVGDGSGGLWWHVRYRGEIQLGPDLTLPDVAANRQGLVRLVP